MYMCVYDGVHAHVPSSHAESNSAEGDGEPEFRYSFRKDRRCGGYLEVKVDKRLSQGSYWKLFSTGELLREAPHFGEGFVALMDILVEELQKLEVSCVGFWFLCFQVVCVRACTP